MPIFKTTDLTLTNSPTVDTMIPCVQNGVTKQISILQIKEYLNDGTLKQLYSGDGYECAPNPITGTGSVSFTSPGLISLYAGATAPSGWLLCNGASLVVANYQNLWNQIRYTYGGSGLNFNLPNLSGRAVFGLDDMGSTTAGQITTGTPTIVGSSAGSIAHTLTADQSPLVDHTHAASGSFAVSVDPDRYGNNSAWATGYPRKSFNTSSGEVGVSLALSIDTSSSPSGVPATQSHPNLPPFMLLNWIIKI